ncbi:MAG: hypothetical protein ACOYJK_01770 [Prevotella sp.]|jgi:hypothetical protein
MKKVFFWSILILSLCFYACSDDDFVQSELIGTWDESYNDPNFIMDGSVMYTFNSNNTYTWVVNQYLSDNTTQTGTDNYAFDIDNRKLIIYHFTNNKTSSVTYNVVKLNSKELSLQKEGTTFSRGTLGSDYRHFVKR